MPAKVSKSLRILLVDDDPLVCDSIRRMLEFDGFHVNISRSGAEAIALCEKETFDLIILDYLMPEMKGDEVAAALKARWPDMPIIMVTADAESIALRDEPPVGVDFLMEKPFQLAALREAVSKVLVKA